MKSTWLIVLALALTAACAAPDRQASSSGGSRMTLANPQPNPATLKPGLAVSYAYPVDVKTLRDAERSRNIARPGPPLVGFDYPDTKLRENALTSRQPERVVAFIDGYVRFDKPGPQRLQFWSNDGLRVRIGGVQVYKHDRRHTCQTKGWVTVTAPEAGWYKVETLFFQRLNTSCLLMKTDRPPAYAHDPR